MRLGGVHVVREVERAVRGHPTERGGPIEREREIAFEDAPEDLVGEREQLLRTGRVRRTGHDRIDTREALGTPPVGDAHLLAVSADHLAHEIEAPQRAGQAQGSGAGPQLGDGVDALPLRERDEPLDDLRIRIGADPADEGLRGLMSGTDEHRGVLPALHEIEVLGGHPNRAVEVGHPPSVRAERPPDAASTRQPAPGPHSANERYSPSMLRLIILLLVVWVILAVIGFTIKGLIWLAILALVLLVITGLVGFIRRRA
jgi:hypothetical protein